MAGYDGLALSLYDKNAQTFTDDGAHNFFSITIADSTTVTTGYIQPFYANVTTSGVLSGSAQVNAFACDMTLGGTPGVETAAFYAYIVGSGTPTVTGLNVNGIVIYMDEIGATPAYRAGVKIYSDDDSIASGLDGAFTTVSANQGLFGAMLAHKGTQYPEFFLWIEDDYTQEGMLCKDAVTATPTFSASLRIKLASAIYRIPLVADSCSN